MADQNTDVITSINTLNGTIEALNSTVKGIPSALEKLKEQLTKSLKENNTSTVKELLDSKEVKQILENNKKISETLEGTIEKNTTKPPALLSTEFFVDIYKKIGLLKDEEKNTDLKSNVDEKNNLEEKKEEKEKGRKVNLLSIDENVLQKLSLTLKKSFKEALEDFTTDNPDAFCCENGPDIKINQKPRTPQAKPSTATDSVPKTAPSGAPIGAPIGGLIPGIPTGVLDGVAERPEELPEPELPLNTAIPIQKNYEAEDTEALLTALQENENKPVSTISDAQPNRFSEEQKKQISSAVEAGLAAAMLLAATRGAGAGTLAVPSTAGIGLPRLTAMTGGGVLAPTTAFAKNSSTLPEGLNNNENNLIPQSKESIQNNSNVDTVNKRAKQVTELITGSIPSTEIPKKPVETSLRPSTESSSSIIEPATSIREDPQAASKNKQAFLNNQLLEQKPVRINDTAQETFLNVQTSNLTVPAGIPTSAISAETDAKVLAGKLLQVIQETVIETVAKSSKNNLPNKKPIVEAQTASPLAGASKLPEAGFSYTDENKNTTNQESVPSRVSSNQVTSEPATGLSQVSTAPTFNNKTELKDLTDCLLKLNTQLEQMAVTMSRPSGAELQGFSNINNNKSTVTNFNNYMGSGDEINSSRTKTEQMLYNFKHLY